MITMENNAMEKLVAAIQDMFSYTWGLGAEARLEYILSIHSFTPQRTEMSFSNIYYRTYFNPHFGLFKIELENSISHTEMRVTIKPVDADGFTGTAVHVIKPTEKQVQWISNKIKKLVVGSKCRKLLAQGKGEGN